MPWKECSVSDERLRFVLECLKADDAMAVICRRHGVSRRVGYKWLARYKERGREGLADQSRAPRSHPNQVEAELERRILALRADHATWGPRKLLAALARQMRDAGGGDVDPDELPVASTVGQMLRRAGLVVRGGPRRRSRSAWAPPGPAAPMASGQDAPNRLWNADYKGWFRTGDGTRCDPLTITDSFSRFLLRCRVVDKLSTPEARATFEAAFREFGLPDAIRTDNGSPFATTGPLGLSRLAVWWLRLGIAHRRIDPGKPQQNGSHERMHLTLKRDAATPPSWSARAQQRRLDAWREEYNRQRPHEGLPGMATPASVYVVPSPRPYPERLPEPQYPDGYLRRRLDDTGKFSWHDRKVFLSKALGDQTVGLGAIVAPAERCGDDDGHGWSPSAARYLLVRFATLELGVLDTVRGRLLRPREKRHLRLA